MLRLHLLSLSQPKQGLTMSFITQWKWYEIVPTFCKTPWMPQILWMWARNHIHATSLEPRSTFPTQSMDALEMGWRHLCWLPYIFVATTNTVEIGILRFQGMPWIHSWNCSRENKRLQHCWYYDLGIAKLVSPTKNANHVCCKGQPISLGGAQCIWGERLLDIYLLPEQLLLDKIRIYRDHYKYDKDNGRFVI
jgi:hypothetical protein